MDGDNALILVVDDDDANRYARTRLLRQAGYRVSEAMTGTEALHRAITERPHLVCLDVKLPDINGIEVCRQIKTSPAMLGTLVLQVSAAFVSDEDKIRGLDGGADAYLVLPVEPRELLAIVRALLRIRQTEQALRESEERYRLAARATNDAIWDWDLETNTVRWNEAMIQLFGWIEPNNCTTIEWWEDRLHPAERSRVVEEVRAVVNDPEKAHWQGEHRFRRSDGSYRDILDRGYMVRGPGGRATRMIGAMLDVTDRKRAQEALLKINVALEQGVRERTQELVRSQDRLRALATELTLTEQRERRRIATELHDHLAQLLALALMKVAQVRQHLRGAGGLTNLEAVDQLLHDAVAYTRTLIADLSPPVLQQFGLPIALKWLGEHMRRHGLQVQVQTEHEDLPLPDDQALLLFQSVRELLFNVVKHGQTAHATVSLKVLTADTLQCTVSDHGRGFDPTVLGHATEPTKGFGLFSIHARLESLKGRFELESGPGHGTRAILSLPYRSPNLPPASQSSAPPDHASFTDLALIRVLLADDHTLMRQGLRSMLDAERGLEVIGEASDGLQAIELARGLKPDVILMDINMPNMDGIEATRRIRDEHPKAIVIGLSMHCSDTLQELMRAAGAATCVSKDSAADELAEAIHTAVRDRDTNSG